MCIPHRHAPPEEPDSRRCGSSRYDGSSMGSKPGHQHPGRPGHSGQHPRTGISRCAATAPVYAVSEAAGRRPAGCPDQRTWRSIRLLSPASECRGDEAHRSRTAPSRARPACPRRPHRDRHRCAARSPAGASPRARGATGAATAGPAVAGRPVSFLSGSHRWGKYGKCSPKTYARARFAQPPR